MSQHDMNLANQDGASFRSDLNNALSAVATNNSGSTAPSTTFAHQWWIDTNNTQLKIRNAANDGFIVVGDYSATNLGLATLASPSFTGDVSFAGNINMSGTGAIDVAAGTTAQRPGTPSNGMFRYNSSDNAFEGYANGAWGAIGGSGGATGGGSDDVFYENSQNVTTDYTISDGKNAGSFGPITIDSGVTVTVGSGEFWTVV